MEAVGIVGRKANSSSAVDKLKKKKKKKRKTKDGKRSTGGSAIRSPEEGSSTGRMQPQKTRSTLSCPADLSQLSSRKSSDPDVEVSFNETLRWLPFIAKHSPAVPPTSSNTLLHAPTVSRLNSNSLTETREEEEERVAIYKMNRRKRYLAAQQTLLDLYPDTNVYAKEDAAGRTEMRHLPKPPPRKTPIFPNTDPLDSPKNSFELVVPSFSNHTDKLATQKVL